MNILLDIHNAIDGAVANGRDGRADRVRGRFRRHVRKRRRSDDVLPASAQHGRHRKLPDSAQVLCPADAGPLRAAGLSERAPHPRAGAAGQSPDRQQPSGDQLYIARTASSGFRRGAARPTLQRSARGSFNIFIKGLATQKIFVHPRENLEK